MRLVGRGAYGEVWLANDIINDRLVALKRLKLGDEREGVRTISHNHGQRFKSVSKNSIKRNCITSRTRRSSEHCEIAECCAFPA